jgi:hypothetical protein
VRQGDDDVGDDDYGYTAAAVGIVSSNISRSSYRNSSGGGGGGGTAPLRPRERPSVRQSSSSSTFVADDYDNDRAFAGCDDPAGLGGDSAWAGDAKDGELAARGLPPSAPLPPPPEALDRSRGSLDRPPQPPPQPLPGRYQVDSKADASSESPLQSARSALRKLAASAGRGRGGGDSDAMRALADAEADAQSSPSALTFSFEDLFSELISSSNFSRLQVRLCLPQVEAFF